MIADRELTTLEKIDAANPPQPRWPALICLMAIGGLHTALPKSLTFAPGWFILMLVALLSIPGVLSRRRGNYLLCQQLGFVAVCLVTATLIGSVGMLVHALPLHVETPKALLKSAAALWVTNVLVFALWYWRLDGGGPHERDLRGSHSDGAFLFPQMTMNPDAKRKAGEERWSPTFVDYLFLSFNTSAALSPTDTAVLSRWAKVLMMVQSAISLIVIALLAARAVNIL